MTTPTKFDVARQRLGQQVKAGQQEQEDALSRRFAALGGANSGAFIKQQQLTKDRAMQAQAQGESEIGAQEMEEKRQTEEIEKQRAFQRAEREASQGFSKTEREAAQGFTKSLYDNDMAFKEKRAGIDDAFREKMFSAEGQRFREQMDLAVKQYQLDELVSGKNLEIQKKMANKKGLFEQIGSFYSPGTWKFGDDNQVANVLTGGLFSSKKSIF